MFKSIDKCNEQRDFLINELGYTILFSSVEVGNYILAKVDKEHGDIQIAEISNNHENPVHTLFGKKEFDKIAAMLK